MEADPMREYIEKLRDTHTLREDECLALLEGRTPELAAYAASEAAKVARAVFGGKIYLRGLIEFTNYCRNDCFYCGIRRGNRKAERYRLDKGEILACADAGKRLGFRTFVLQGGEDAWYTDDRLTDIVAGLRAAHPDCAITLSAGERSRDSYLRLFQAGASRYLLRHETADAAHYAKLHPPELTLEQRMRCLRDLKEIGYQTGCGFMVGSPWQTPENLAADLAFIQAFRPEMVGIGPFIPHHDTPFASHPGGSVEVTLFLLSLVRVMLPRALLPATTALGTLDPEGREKGILAGANVLMPNLSPLGVRTKYSLYDDKICTDLEAAENVERLRRGMERIGHQVVNERGDYR